jgi:penicillin amidase
MRVAAACLFAMAVSCSDRGEPPRPKRDVEIRVDSLGISHVYALSDEGAMFGAGYAMARDRLFQMEINRRRAQGRSAELFGPSKRKDDLAGRAFRFASLGAADVARMRSERPNDALLLDAWARGINLRIAEIRSGAAPRPYGLGSGSGEFDFVPDDWTAEDGAAVGKLLGFGLSSTLDSEVLATAVYALSPDFAAKVPLSLPAYDAFPLAHATPKSLPRPPRSLRDRLGMPRLPIDSIGPLSIFGEGQGSNNWAVAADRTDNGRPYLAGDPHQALGSPIRLWPFHMSSTAGGGTLDVIGFAFAGTPSVELGHNAHVGWTATTAFADVMDLVGVNLNDDEDAVIVGDQRLPVVSRDEVLRVREDDGSMSEETITIRDVPGHGVLLPPDLLPVPSVLLTPTHEILFLWTGFAPTLEGSAYLDMDRAKNVDEWEKAVDVIEVGAQNFVGADRKDISYRVHMRLPDRGPPSSKPMPWRLLQGTSADVLWTRGDIPAEKLPRLRAPLAGYIATANTDPFGFTADGDVEDDPFYYGAFFANGMRLAAIQDHLDTLLAKGAKVTRADMESLQRDQRSVMADAVIPKLVEAWKHAETDPALAKWKGDEELSALVTRLDAWDRQMRRDSGDALVALGVEWFAAKSVTERGLGKLLFEAIAEKSPPFLMGVLRNVLDARFEKADALLPEGGRDALLLGALDETRAWLLARFGTADPSKLSLASYLAAEFPTSFGKELEVGRTPIGGSFDTIDVAPAPFFEQKGGASVPRDQIACTEMAMYRMVIGFDDDGTPRATFDFARGTSEDPSSAHFGDRQAGWADAAHVPLWFRRSDVEAHTESRVVLGGVD